ncbi:MAG TPA: TOMM precursor leader peptide-binding protein [Micromonosporaceae bacterium]|jgi:bacteriocin biosynthesis cyclodehydratase domain-containing protein
MARQPVRRPILLPTVRRLWRDHRRLQVGTDPGRAVVLELADPLQARLLDLLDGTHTERALVRAARHAGIPPGEASALLAALTSAGYVVDVHALQIARATEATRRRLATETSALALRDPRPNAVMRRRLQAQVLVTGASRLAVPIASILAASGVAGVHTDCSGVARLSDATPAGLLPGDAHRPRGVAAADALRRVAPELDVTQVRRGSASFVVLVGFSAPANLTAFSYGSRRLAHLAVSVRDGTVVVGPLVRPGESPCLNCLDLHRADLDPDWQAVAAQLQTSPEVAEPLAATTALAAAAFAAHDVLTHIDGGLPATLGATVEIAEPGRSTRRQWGQHPSCGCRRRARRRLA